MESNNLIWASQFGNGKRIEHLLIMKDVYIKNLCEISLDMRAIFAIDVFRFLHRITLSYIHMYVFLNTFLSGSYAGAWCI